MRLRSWRGLLALLVSFTSTAPAQTWPTKPVRVINGNAPGGTADVSIRVIGDVVSRALGQAMITENRPGASGGIAMDTVARAAPDGYTLLVAADSSLYDVLPNVPTMAEAGYPGIDLAQWFGLLGPAGMPKDVLARLSLEFQKAIADPEDKRKLAGAALETVGGISEKFARRIREQGVVWARIAKDVGLRAE